MCRFEYCKLNSLSSFTDFARCVICTVWGKLFNVIRGCTWWRYLWHRLLTLQMFFVGGVCFVVVWLFLLLHCLGHLIFMKDSYVVLIITKWLKGMHQRLGWILFSGTFWEQTLWYSCCCTKSMCRLDFDVRYWTCISKDLTSSGFEYMQCWYKYQKFVLWC